MYNLHAHSLLSDGCLLPSEVAMRYFAKGYKAVAITDHTDYSTVDIVVPAIVSFCRKWPKEFPIQVLPGIELTHIPLEQFEPLAAYARQQGIKVIVAHGETVTEPVYPGTNRAALNADIDILAHPGRISDEDARLAQEKGVFLEITSRRGHCATNQHVVEVAKRIGALMVLNNDSHEPADIISPEELRAVGLNAGLTNTAVDEMLANLREFIEGKKLLDN